MNVGDCDIDTVAQGFPTKSVCHNGPGCTITTSKHQGL